MPTRCVFTIAVVALALVAAAMPATAQASTASNDRSEPALVHDSWTTGANMPTPRTGAATGTIAVSALGSKIYVVGGVTAPYGTILAVNEIYNTQTNTWTTGAPMPIPTCYTAGSVVNGILYVIGGSNGIGGETDAVFAYNPATDIWSTVAPLPRPKNSLSAVVNNGIIYVIGGDSDIGRDPTVESYNPATNVWTEEAPMLLGKSNPNVGVPLGASLLGRLIVSAGGFPSDNEGYNVRNNTWTELTDDPTSRVASCAGAIGTLLYVAGGGDVLFSESLTLNESYSTMTNSWTTLAPMPQDTEYPGSAVVGGRLYCLGGYSSTTGPVAAVQIYQP